MSALPDQSAPDPSAGTVTLDRYLGRQPSAGQSTVSSGWPRDDQLRSRFEWYQHMREDHPVARDPETGIWGVFRYPDVRRALTDVTDFGNELPGLPDDDPITGTMLRVNPPRHRELRNLINQAFTSRSIAGMRGQIQVLSTELLDGAAAGGSLDVVTSIARVLPTLVIGSLLGIDLSRRNDFVRWTEAFMQSLIHGPDAEQSEILAEMQQYFTDIIAQRRREPGTDLISGAVRAEMQGSHLTDRDILQFCKLLLIAGSETTTHLITNTVLCLQQRPDLIGQIRADPTVLLAFIEEVLRFVSPVQAAPRCANREVTMYDQVIPAGDMVYLWLGSANRDRVEFADADSFLIGRNQGRQLAFGYGIHFCVGAVLAKLETEVMIATMLADLPGEWVVPDLVSVYPAHEMCGLNSLPLTWR